MAVQVWQLRAGGGSFCGNHRLRLRPPARVMRNVGRMGTLLRHGHREQKSPLVPEISCRTIRLQAVARQRSDYRSDTTQLTTERCWDAIIISSMAESLDHSSTILRTDATAGPDESPIR